MIATPVWAVEKGVPGFKKRRLQLPKDHLLQDY